MRRQRTSLETGKNKTKDEKGKKQPIGHSLKVGSPNSYKDSRAEWTLFGSDPGQRKAMEKTGTIDRIGSSSMVKNSGGQKSARGSGQKGRPPGRELCRSRDSHERKESG